MFTVAPEGGQAISVVLTSECRRHLEKSFVTPLQKLYRRLFLKFPGNQDGLSVQPLNSVLKCRAVALLKNVGTNNDDSVWSHGQKESVEGRVVQPAKRDSVSDDRFTLWFRIRQDVGRLKQFAVPQATEGALIPISEKNPLAERPLMQTATGQRRDVPSPNFSYAACGRLRLRKEIGVDCVINRHRKGECLGCVTSHIHGPHCQISARNNPVKVRQRQAILHRKPQPDIISVLRVGSSIPIPHEIV